MRYDSTILNSYDDAPKYWQIAVMSAVISALLNGVLYVTGVTLGIFAGVDVRSAIGGELTIGPIAIVSFMMPLIGFMTFHVMTRSRPDSYPLFRNATWVLVAGSMLGPLSIDAWTLQQILAAQLMHVVVAASMLYGINRWRGSVHLNPERNKQ